MSKRYRIAPVAAVCIVAATACATPPAKMHYTLAMAVAPPRGTVQLVDSRPAETRVSRGPSAFGEPKWFYGDEQFSPDRLTILRQKMESRLTAGTTVVRTITITRFDVVNYYAKTHADARAANNPGMMFGAAGALVGAVIGELMKPSIEPEDQISCEVQGFVDGRQFVASFARAYRTTGGMSHNQFDDPAVLATVSTVLDICTEVAAQQAAAAAGLQG